MLENELYALLLDASRKAFREVQAAHPDETFYTFGLIHGNDHDGYIILPSCNSEEAHLRRWDLTETDRTHQTLEWFYSRWAWDDWRYYRRGRQYFSSVSTWIADNLFQSHEDEEEIAKWINVENAVTGTCLKVLKALDNEKFFGQGKAREGVVLNIVSENRAGGDVEDISHVYLLNPTSVYERWCIEMELFEHAHAFFRI